MSTFLGAYSKYGTWYAYMLTELKDQKDRVHEESKKLIAGWKPAVNRMLGACLSFDTNFLESHSGSNLIDSRLPAHILGKEFGAFEIEQIKEYITSRIWISYRKDFQPIGGVGPTSDQGWGCMLRCGQMLIAQALVTLHLGNDWIWSKDSRSPLYRRILRLFQDKKNCAFSIHQIAHMGISEGKNIGEWFGPNTIAQVLKKLVIYDRWSRIAIHVALDNLLISSDVRTMALTDPPECLDRSQITTEIENAANDKQSCSNAEGCNSFSKSKERSAQTWRPLLLIIPLRLGLATVKRCYLPAIQMFFKLPQCLGMIGGRPNHALYFIGIVGDRLIYLDPHICQNFVNLDIEEETPKKNDYMEMENFNDSSYHCSIVFSMPFDSLDPSLALAFLCSTESDFNILANDLRTKLMTASSPPLFGLSDVRPRGFPPFIPYTGESAKIQEDFADLGDLNDSYDEFEILE